MNHDERIKKARIEYLESQIRIDSAAFERYVKKGTKHLEGLRAALRELKPEVEPAPGEAT